MKLWKKLKKLGACKAAVFWAAQHEFTGGKRGLRAAWLRAHNDGHYLWQEWLCDKLSLDIEEGDEGRKPDKWLRRRWKQWRKYAKKGEMS